VEKSP